MVQLEEEKSQLQLESSSDDDDCQIIEMINVKREEEIDLGLPQGVLDRC